MSSIKDSMVKKIAYRLADEGHAFIIKAYENSDYNKNKTQNLHDSYGCAVYHNGKLVSGTKRFMTSRATQGRYNDYTGDVEYGRQEIDEYLRNYKPNTKGFELVLAAAMFYGGILESGSGLRQKYKVISFMSQEAKEIADKYKGKYNTLK